MSCAGWKQAETGEKSARDTGAPWLIIKRMACCARHDRVRRDETTSVEHCQIEGFLNQVCINRGPELIKS